MNWTERQKKYPKSIVLIKKWLHLKLDKEGDFGLNQISKLFHTERRLFDFFDGEGIYIGLDYHYAIGVERWFSMSITWDVGYVKKPLKTGIRTEAEEVAFLKAFEILEQRENEK